MKSRFVSFFSFCNSKYLLLALNLTFASINNLISLNPSGNIFEQISRPPTNTNECGQLKISFFVLAAMLFGIDGILAILETEFETRFECNFGFCNLTILIVSKILIKYLILTFSYHFLSGLKLNIDKVIQSL